MTKRKYVQWRPIRVTKAALLMELETLKRERAIEQSAVNAFTHIQTRLGNIEESLAAIRKEMPKRFFTRIKNHEQ